MYGAEFLIYKGALICKTDSSNNPSIHSIHHKSTRVTRQTHPTCHVPQVPTAVLLPVRPLFPPTSSGPQHPSASPSSMYIFIITECSALPPVLRLSQCNSLHRFLYHRTAILSHYSTKASLANNATQTMQTYCRGCHSTRRPASAS